MFDHQDHRAREVRVGELRHRKQQAGREVGRLHHGEVFRKSRAIAARFATNTAPDDDPGDPSSKLRDRPSAHVPRAGRAHANTANERRALRARAKDAHGETVRNPVC